MVGLPIHTHTLHCFASPVRHSIFQSQRLGQVGFQCVQIAGDLADARDVLGAAAFGEVVDGQLVAGPGAGDGVGE